MMEATVVSTLWPKLLILDSTVGGTPSDFLYIKSDKLIFKIIIIGIIATMIMIIK